MPQPYPRQWKRATRHGAPIRVRPTRADILVANAVTAHTNRSTEKAARFATWGADEHILCVAAVGWWLYARRRSRQDRRVADHILLTTAVASVLPHLLKTIFDQERPDRLTIEGHLRGAPFSGRRLDAFPSGHAVHIRALASAASQLPTRLRNLVWGVGAGLVLTRVILLAHWASDVAAGLVVGAVTERLLRYVTGYGRARNKTVTTFVLRQTQHERRRDMATESSETGTLIGSDKVEGTAVYGADDRKIGSIERVMIDKVSGRVSYAVLSFGGILGIGDDHYPLPWQSLKYDTNLGGYVTGITAKQLEGAPKYLNDNGWNWADTSKTRAVNDYYGVPVLA